MMIVSKNGNSFNNDKDSGCSEYSNSYQTGFKAGCQSVEEYMRQHDGGDRDEYLQEMEHSDPEFYVPPLNDAGFSATTTNSTS
jgi:hypothetical protein